MNSIEQGNQIILASIDDATVRNVRHDWKNVTISSLQSWQSRPDSLVPGSWSESINNFDEDQQQSLKFQMLHRQHDLRAVTLPSNDPLLLANYEFTAHGNADVKIWKA